MLKKKNPSHGVFNRLEGGVFFSTYQNISGSYRDTEILSICVGESKSDSLLSFILFKLYFFTESQDHVGQQGPPKVMQSSLWSKWGQLSRLLKASTSPFTNSHIPVCVSCLFLFLCTSILRVIMLAVGSNKLSLYLCFKAEQTQFFQFLYIHHDLQSSSQLGGSPQGSTHYISIFLVLKLLLGSSTLDISKMQSPNTKHRRTTSFNLLAPLLLITGFG